MRICFWPTLLLDSGSYAPLLSEKRNSFLRLLKNKAFKEESRTKNGVYAIGEFTTLESNKSLQPYGTRPHFQGHPRPCAHHRDDMPTPAEKCRHCLCVRSTPPLPSQPIACRGVRHSLPPCFGAAYVVQPAVLPRAARGGPLPVTRQGPVLAAARPPPGLASYWRSGAAGGTGGTDAVGGKGRVPFRGSLAALGGTNTRTRSGPAVGMIFVVAA